MDAVAGLLDGPRARGAFLLRSLLDPPWSMRIQDEAPLTLVAVVRGEAWIVPDGGEPVAARARATSPSCAGPEPYTVADDPATPPQVVIHPGQRCTTPDGERADRRWSLGVRTWGNSPDGATVHAHRHLPAATARSAGGCWAALPPLLVLPGDELGLPADRAARRGDRQGRARPGGRARPAARPAADRRRCGPGSPAPRPRRPAGTARTATRSSARRCGAAQQPRPPVDGRRAGAARPASRAPRSPAASPSSSASRR